MFENKGEIYRQQAKQEPTLLKEIKLFMYASQSPGTVSTIFLQPTKSILPAPRLAALSAGPHN
jgi:hypothetical protein